VLENYVECAWIGLRTFEASPAGCGESNGFTAETLRTPREISPSTAKNAVRAGFL